MKDDVSKNEHLIATIPHRTTYYEQDLLILRTGRHGIIPSFGVAWFLFSVKCTVVFLSIVLIKELVKFNIPINGQKTDVSK